MRLFCQIVLILSLPLAGFGEVCAQSFNVVQKQGVTGTIAGSGATSYTGDGGKALFAGLNAPTGIAIDGEGNLYIADTGNHVIRKVDAKTGIISTVAGTGVGGFSTENGLAIEVQLNAPESVGVAENGDLYISDTGNHRLRKVSAESGMISTIYGTPELTPGAIVVDNLNSIVYFTDRVEENPPSVLVSIMRIFPSGDIAPFLANIRGHDALDVDLLGNVFLFAHVGGSPSFGIVRYDRNSATIDSVFVRDSVFAISRYTTISALAVTSESDIYYTDIHLGGILGVSRYGVIDLGSGFRDVGKEEIGSGYKRIVDMTVDKQDNVLFVDKDQNKIFRITYQSSFEPDIKVPSTFNFGEVVVGTKKTRSLEIDNKGNMRLGILRLSSSISGVSIQPASGDIESGANAIFDVLIEPSASGDINGAIDILSTDPDEPSASIPIMGKAFAAEISLDLESGPENKRVHVLKGVGSRDSVTVQLFGADMPTLNGYSVTLQYDPTFIDTNTIAFEPGPLMPNALAVTQFTDASMTLSVAATGSSLSEASEGLMGTLSFAVSENFEHPDSTDINLTNVTFSLGDGTLLEAVRSGSITLSAAIALVGDFNGDGSVGFADFLQLAQAFGKKSTDAGFDSRLDLDSDGEVGFSDFLLFAANFGATT